MLELISENFGDITELFVPFDQFNCGSKLDNRKLKLMWSEGQHFSSHEN